jgi:serine phosphatase RsbU (regulator of sigma subunit)
MFGSAGLDRVVSACAGSAPQQFVDDIAETIAAFGAGASPEDDLTLLALKYVAI